jgi:glycerophosphoryl diester phosphodiesterase
MSRLLEVQGHRGARGLKPENTLPSFEAALDVGVSSLETDIHLTRDRVPLIVHDPFLGENICTRLPGASASGPPQPAVSSLTLAQVRSYRADRNPDPRRFPGQDGTETPLALLFARLHGFDPFTLPALADLFAFVQAYAGEMGTQAGKTPSQQERARRVLFDLELKRVPFRPEWIGDYFSGEAAGLLEQNVMTAIRQAGVLNRTIVRSFDHASVRTMKGLEPTLRTGVLVAGTAPISPAQLVKQAGADVYCPEYHFLDERQVLQLHASRVRVLPWTVNAPEDWQRLINWGVDGITTDYPDRLIAWLHEHGVGME